MRARGPPGRPTARPASSICRLAGWWHALVSVPVFQFLLLRWYFRVFIWARFLLQVSRINLRLVPTHPDRVGGLGFLTNVVYAFTPILLAHGALLAGLIADRIFFDGAKLTQFIVEIFGGVGVLVFLVLFPLMVFAGQLARVKRTGLGEYGGLAQHYVREFDAKWLRGERPGRAVDGQRRHSVTRRSRQQLRGDPGRCGSCRSRRKPSCSWRSSRSLPVAPLLLTMISFEELIKRLLSAVF